MRAHINCIRVLYVRFRPPLHNLWGLKCLDLVNDMNTIHADADDKTTAKGRPKLISSPCAVFVSHAQSPDKSKAQCICLMLSKTVFFSPFIMECNKQK